MTKQEIEIAKKITDIRIADINGLPKHMILLKIYTKCSLLDLLS